MINEKFNERMLNSVIKQNLKNKINFNRSVRNIKKYYIKLNF